jgi:hypothetical protein
MMTKLILSGAAVTAIAAAPLLGSTATAFADDPPGCADVNGVQCEITAPGVEGVAGPEGVTGTAPGVEGTAGPGGVNGCVDAVGCLNIPVG